MLRVFGLNHTFGPQICTCTYSDSVFPPPKSTFGREQSDTSSAKGWGNQKLDFWLRGAMDF